MVRFFKAMRRSKPKYIYGYPSAIFAFAKSLQTKGYYGADIGLRVIICTGETLLNFQRKVIEDFFRCRVVNEYGCSELGIIAFECENRKLHLSLDDLYVEFVDDNGNRTVDGGNIIVSDLFNYDAPLIRYKVGDISNSGIKPKCECGRKLPFINGVEGRISEMIELPSGKKIHSEVFHYISDAIVERDDGVKEFRVKQTSENEFLVELVRDYGYSTDTEKLIRKLFHDKFETEMNINIEVKDKLKRDNSGKLRYFIPLDEQEIV